MPAPETLFGQAVDGMETELSVFWRPSKRAKALRSITLAAVAELTDQYLPPDDFDDFFDEGESLGDDTA